MNLKLSLIVNPRTNSKVWDKLRQTNNEYIHEYWFDDDDESPEWVKYSKRSLQSCKNIVPIFKNVLARYSFS